LQSREGIFGVESPSTNTLAHGSDQRCFIVAGLNTNASFYPPSPPPSTLQALLITSTDGVHVS
jgi:hypothetical protein